MEKDMGWALGPEVDLVDASLVGGGWLVSAVGRGDRGCPRLRRAIDFAAQLALSATAGFAGSGYECGPEAPAWPLALPQSSMRATDFCGAAACDRCSAGPPDPSGRRGGAAVRPF